MGKLAAIIATTAAVTTLTAVPAHAEPRVQYQLAGSNRCLSDSGTDIVLRACNEAINNQIWIVPNTDADIPRNVATGKCLTAVTTGNVSGEDCGAGNQRWRRESSGGTSFRFRNLANGKCLTAQVTVAECTASSAKWNGLR